MIDTISSSIRVQSTLLWGSDFDWRYIISWNDILTASGVMSMFYKDGPGPGSELLIGVAEISWYKV
jgi:hypothetical protein